MSKHIGSSGLRAIVEKAFAGVAFAATVGRGFGGHRGDVFPRPRRVTRRSSPCQSCTVDGVEELHPRCGGTVYDPVDYA